MIRWKDGSHPVLRRKVRGHHVVYMGISVGSVDRVQYSVFLHCDRCLTSWHEEIGWSTRQRLTGWRPERALTEIVRLAVSRTPPCEEAYRTMVARDVIES